MDACRRHPAGRRLVRLQAPVVPIERQELVVTEVGLDLVNASQFSGVRFRQHLGDRGLPPALVPHPENEPGVATQANGLFGAGLVQGQRLLAKHVLPSPDCRLDLFAMQRVRRRQNDGFDLGIGERIRIVRRQGDALLVTERARRLEIWLHGANHVDVGGRSAQNAEHFLAPPAHADESDSDRPAHSGVFSRLERRDAPRPWRSPKRAAPIGELHQATGSPTSADENRAVISAKAEARPKTRLTCILSDAPPLWRRHCVWRRSPCGPALLCVCAGSALLRS